MSCATMGKSEAHDSLDYDNFVTRPFRDALSAESHIIPNVVIKLANLLGGATSSSSRLVVILGSHCR